MHDVETNVDWSSVQGSGPKAEDAEKSVLSGAYTMEHRYLSSWDYLPGEHHVNGDD